MKAKAAPYKKENVKEIISLLEKYPIIGAVDLENLPAPALQLLWWQFPYF